MPKITTREEFEDWLKGQSQETCVKIATRAALRALPFVSQPSPTSKNRDIYALRVFRCILTSGVAGKLQSPEVGTAAGAASAVAVGVEYVDDSADHATAAARVAARVAKFPNDFTSVRIAEDAARAAELAGIAASFAAGTTATGVAAENAIRAAAYADAMQESRDEEMFDRKLWPVERPPHEILAAQNVLSSLLDSAPAWFFWRRWYNGMFTGQPLDWRLQETVALIDREEWEKGPERIAELIAEIEIEFKVSRHAADNKSDIVSSQTARAVAGRMAANRDGITLISAGLLDQIADFRERLRGDNEMDTEFKDGLLAFLDDLAEKVRMLLDLLPEQAQEIDDEAGEEGALWLVEFRSALFKNAREYSSPDNIAGAMIPTGIILGCTALGSVMGMPVPGTVVGGLITGQLKPGKAADDLLNPKSGD